MEGEKEKEEEREEIRKGRERYIERVTEGARGRNGKVRLESTYPRSLDSPRNRKYLDSILSAMLRGHLGRGSGRGRGGERR